MKTTTHRFCSFFVVFAVATLVLTVNSFGQGLSIVQPPVSQAVPEGGTAILSVSVDAALPITYTWHRNYELTNYYTVTLNSTNCTLLLSNMTPSKACFFRLDVQNAFGRAARQVVVAVISSGMETNGFALSIRGLTNSTWRIECSTNLQSAEWLTLTNIAIPKAPPVIKYVDLAGTNLNRFYRVIPKVY